MSTLAQKLTEPEVRPKVVEACVGLVESEVAGKRGFSGAAIKAGFRVVKALKPGMIPGVVNTLLPEFAEAMQPIYDKTAGDAGDNDAFVAYITANPDETADALLKVTDARAERAANKTVAKTYGRMRGSAKDNVLAAVPGLGKALAPFL